VEYLSAVNWEKFQQYKDRDPKWIKVHRGLLDDYEFTNLPDTSKAHLVLIWLLAAKKENKIPYDETWITKQINATAKVNLKILISAGFLVPYNGTKESVQNCTEMYRNVPRERGEEEEEEEEEGEGDPRADPPKPKTGSHVPFEEIREAWNAMAEETGVPKVEAWPDKRKAKLRTRWKEPLFRERWRDAFREVSLGSFMRGGGPPRDGGKPWVVGFDWFVANGENYVKALEGNYRDEDGGNGKASALDGVDPEIREHLRMQRKKP
jgi:hypothetical protein